LLLPSVRGSGKIILALTKFLSQIHNEFIERYRAITKTGKRKTTSKTEFTVPLRSITQSHLVSYNLDSDLIPLINTFCDYSSEKGSQIGRAHV